MNAPEYQDWDCDITCTTAKAIALVFDISLGEACKYGLDDMTDEDYDAVMDMKRKLERGDIVWEKVRAFESQAWI